MLYICIETFIPEHNLLSLNNATCVCTFSELIICIEQPIDVSLFKKTISLILSSP